MQEKREADPQDSYLNGSTTLEQYRHTLLNKVDRAKDKLDAVSKLNTQGVLQIDEDFVTANKLLVKSILWDFEYLQKVLEKIQNENYKSYDSHRILLTSTIKQQFKRFQRMIPPPIKSKVDKSRIASEKPKSSLFLFKNKSEQKNQMAQTSVEDEKVGQLMDRLHQIISEDDIKEKQKEKEEEVRQSTNKEVMIGVVLILALILILGVIVLRKGLKNAFGDL